MKRNSKIGVLAILGLGAVSMYFSLQNDQEVGTGPVIVVVENTDVAPDLVEQVLPEVVSPDPVQEITPDEVPQTRVIPVEEQSRGNDPVTPAPQEIDVPDVSAPLVADQAAALLPLQQLNGQPDLGAGTADQPPVMGAPNVPVPMAGPAIAPQGVQSGNLTNGTFNQPILAPDLPDISPVEDTVVGLAIPSLAVANVPGVAPLPDTLAPEFDLVRVDASGNILVAGRAAPNAMVNITSGDEIIGQTRAGSNGEFVAFLSSPSGVSQNLQLTSELKETGVVTSQAEVIILPVQEDNQQSTPIVVLATQDEIQVIQPSGLSVPDNVSLDTISYNELGDVQLAGRGQPGNLARIYADQHPIGEVLISDSGGWSLSISGIEAGRYVLRVDEIDDAGTVASRVESPFQREFPEAEALQGFAQGSRIIVQPGNTLWLMAQQAYGDGNNYTQIFGANQETIRDPNLIYPGQVFSIPRDSE